MTTLGNAKMPSLKDKIEAQEAERLANEAKVEEKPVKKTRKSK